MVEFALVLPILVLLTIGAVEFGIVVKDWINVTNTARIAGRAAAVSRFDHGPGCPGVQQAVDAAMTRQGFATAAASFSSSDASCVAGSEVTVTVTHPWSVSVPFLQIPVSSGTLSSDVTEKVE